MTTSVKVGGTWRPAQAFARVGGAWRSVVGVFVHVGGTWVPVSAGGGGGGGGGTPSTLAVSIGDPTVTFGTTGAASYEQDVYPSAVTGGTAPYSYAWSKTAGTTGAAFFQGGTTSASVTLRVSDVAARSDSFNLLLTVTDALGASVSTSRACSMANM